MHSNENVNLYLKPTHFIDSSHPNIIDFVNNIELSNKNSREKAILLFNIVRDQIIYDPFTFNLKPDYLKASNIVKQKKSFCIPKAILLAAVARASDIPARLGFANLKNYRMGKELKELLQTNLLAWHGYVELFLNDKWIKATPAYNKDLSEHTNTPSVEFDGKTHAIFPEKDNDGNRHMEYLTYHGTFPDLPLEKIKESMINYYPMLKEHDELKRKYF